MGVMVMVITIGAARSESQVLTPSLVANRTSGVAPLPVFFDATATKLQSGSLHNLETAWDFDDPESKYATARGFCVAHVFENPGTYQVKLRLSDVAGAAVTTLVKVTVTPFNGKNYFVSDSGGNDSNDGTTPAKPFKTYAKAMSVLGAELAKGPSAIRILFKRGDTFNATGEPVIGFGHEGRPAILGAYGNGPKPVITGALSLYFLGANKGFRVMDIHYRGTNPANPTVADLTNGIDDFLMLRVDARSTDALAVVGIGGKKHRNMFFVDCTNVGFRNYGYFIGGENLAIIGNEIRGASSEHCIRVFLGRKVFIHRNRVHDPALGKQALKIHGINEVAGSTRYVVISENEFKGNSWTVSFAPQNQESVEYLNDIVFEDNVVLPGDNTQYPTIVAVALLADGVTLRNNVFAGGTKGTYCCLYFLTHNTLPGARDVRIVHNTLSDLRTSGEAEFACVESSGSRQVAFQNNILHAPSLGSFTGILFACPLSELFADGNIYHVPNSNPPVVARSGSTGYSLDAWRKLGKGIRTQLVDPKLTDPAKSNWTPRADSPAIRAGVPVPSVFDAFDGKLRKRGVADDVGAFEHPGSSIAVLAPTVVKPGQAVPLTLSGPSHAGQMYQLALSRLTSPGIAYPGGPELPLRFDSLFILSVLQANQPWFKNFIGVLDQNGKAVATLVVPQLPEMQGFSLHAAGITLDGFRATAVSEAVRVLVQ
jgi:PKD repeat protein